ncbi:MAG TPA: DUF4389 domain-containing protein [Solirubrobacterales bacterium]|jgi:hypothetical protein|nr:DUF4389 domain-containing protein [Solirubrobacterales bacterium]
MYPITYEADLNPTPSRGTTFFRILLAIPWLIVAVFWGLLFAFTHLFAWVALIILGRYPEWLYNFNAGVLRFSIRVTAWLYLQTDEWPPFGLSDDPNYPIRVNVPANPPERQSRLKALFRIILALPVAIVLSYGTSYIQLLAGLVAWLTIVFRGYLPEGIFNMMSFINGFHTRVLAYIAFLTDSYPPIGIERGKGADGVVVPPTPPAAPAV